MSFDWLDLLNSRGISYRDSGPNVSRGNVVVRCPFCGDTDEGEHMSISVEGAGWRCFRRPMEHRGRSPVRLIAALCHCSFEEAARIAGVRDIPVNLLAQVRAKLAPIDAPATVHMPLKLPLEFYEFSERTTGRPYLGFLMERLGIDRTRALAWARTLNLRYAKSGPFAGRVIFPIHLHNTLMSWTGRAISHRAEIRYKTLSTDFDKAKEDGAQALAPTSDLLLFYDQLQQVGMRTLYIVEGPFDAFKVRVLGQHRGVMATCLFGLNLSPAQIALLADVLPHFARKYLLLDQKTLAASLRMMQVLSPLGVQMKTLPDGVKDPGALSWSQVPFLTT